MLAFDQTLADLSLGSFQVVNFGEPLIPKEKQIQGKSDQNHEQHQTGEHVRRQASADHDHIEEPAQFVKERVFVHNRRPGSNVLSDEI
jgi:hypothetical protein